MSRLLVLTEPMLVNGYLLAGAEAFAARNREEAEQRLQNWMADGFRALVAVDQNLYDQLTPAFHKRLNQSSLLIVIIPAVSFELSPQRWQQRIQEMIHQAIGVHITFKEGG